MSSERFLRNKFNLVNCERFMYITSLISGDDSNPVIIDDPTLDQVRKKIFDLDGSNHRAIMMIKCYESNNDDVRESMEIAGGGVNGLYICLFCSEEDDYEWYLYNPLESEEEVEIVRANLETFPRTMCLSLSDVLDVAETYASDGKRNKAFYWKGFLGTLSIIESPSLK